MSREFTKREKIMLVALALIIISLCYYKFVLEPINTQVEEYNSATAMETDELTTNSVLVGKIRDMQASIDEAKADGNYQPIPVYDNCNTLLAELYSILDTTNGYSLTFGTVTEDGYVMLRPISMDFSTGTYEEARSVIDLLHDSPNSNQISDVNIARGDSVYQTTLKLTYFEVQE